MRAPTPTPSVERYVSSGTFQGTLELQRELVGGIRDDIRKYAEGLDQARIANVFEHIPAQLAKENKSLLAGIRKQERLKRDAAYRVYAFENDATRNPKRLA